MSLSIDPSFNVQYLPDFYTREQADALFEQLKELAYFVPVFKIKHRSVKPKREIAAFGDEGLIYSFSGTHIPATAWTPLLLEIRDQVERQTGCTYNFVLLNKYVDGSSFISQHRDDESCLDSTFPLAVLSFGETRTLDFKKTGSETKTLSLEHGSLYIMEKPTNDFYTHGIAPDASKKEMRISLSFRHVLPPAAKKLKMDELPDDDWFSRHYANRPESPPQECAVSPVSSSLVAQWDLGDHLFVNIVFQKNCLRLHIRRYNELLRPTQQGIVMLNSTWSELCEKLTFYDFNDCFVVNRQLLVASMDHEKTRLQQMFDSKVSGYILKPSFLTLTKEQLLKLKNCMSDISHVLSNVQVCKLLPNLILSKAETCQVHFDSEEQAHFHLFNSLENEIQIALQKNFPCTGCLFNDPSQFNHECMMQSFYEKFSLFREKILLTLNVFHIVKHLREKCMCYYTASFMQRWDMDSVETYLQSCH